MLREVIDRSTKVSEKSVIANKIVKAANIWPEVANKSSKPANISLEVANKIAKATNNPSSRLTH